MLEAALRLFYSKGETREMKRWVCSVLVVVVVVTLGGSQGLWAHPSEREIRGRYIPRAAAEAIKRSQGEIQVVFTLKDGTRRQSMAKGVLGSDEGFVITALHVLRPGPSLAEDVMPEKTEIYFNGTRAVMHAIFPGHELALLRVDMKSLLYPRKPAQFVRRNPLLVPAFAMISGITSIPTEERIMIAFTDLPFRARVVAHGYGSALMPREIAPRLVTFLYLDETAKLGFSGALLVGAVGQGLGIIIAVEDGYTIALSAESVEHVIKEGHTLVPWEESRKEQL